MPPKASPPRQAGRPSGSSSRSTVSISEAITAVYRDLQESAGGDHRHFLAWAKENPGDFYRMSLPLLPLRGGAETDRLTIGSIMFASDHD
jgi:hypothetical protein